MPCCRMYWYFYHFIGCSKSCAAEVELVNMASWVLAYLQVPVQEGLWFQVGLIEHWESMHGLPA